MHLSVLPCGHDLATDPGLTDPGVQVLKSNLYSWNSLCISRGRWSGLFPENELREVESLGHPFWKFLILYICDQVMFQKCCGISHSWCRRWELECNTVLGPSAPSYSYLLAMVTNAKETVVKSTGMISVLVEPRLGSGRGRQMPWTVVITGLLPGCTDCCQLCPGHWVHSKWCHPHPISSDH